MQHYGLVDEDQHLERTLDRSRARMRLIRARLRRHAELSGNQVNEMCRGIQRHRTRALLSVRVSDNGVSAGSVFVNHRQRSVVAVRAEYQASLAVERRCIGTFADRYLGNVFAGVRVGHDEYAISASREQSFVIDIDSEPGGF